MNATSVVDLWTWVPHKLLCEQMEEWVRMCEECLRMLEKNGNLLTCIVTGDESWVSHYNPSLKQETSAWKLLSEPRKKKVRQHRLPLKVMLTVFFHFEGILYQMYLPPNATINSIIYRKMIQTLRYCVGRKRPTFVISRSCTTITQDRTFHEQQQNFLKTNLCPRFRILHTALTSHPTTSGYFRTWRSNCEISGFRLAWKFNQPFRLSRSQYPWLNFKTRYSLNGPSESVNA